MLKTGLVGHFPELFLKVLNNHKAISVTKQLEFPGKILPASHGSDLFDPNWEEFINSNDILVFGLTNTDISGLLKEGVKKSKHILLTEYCSFSYDTIQSLIKLRREAQTVFQIFNSNRSNKLLKYYRDTIVHPAMTQFTMEVTGEFDKSLLRLLDLLLYLNPFIIKKINTFIHSSTGEPLFINARTEFDNGSSANLMISRADSKNTESIKIEAYLKQMTIKMNLTSNKLQIFNYSGIPNGNYGETVSFSGCKSELFLEKIDQMYEAITKNESNENDLFELAEIVRLRKVILEKTRDC